MTQNTLPRASAVPYTYIIIIYNGVRGACLGFSVYYFMEFFRRYCFIYLFIFLSVVQHYRVFDRTFG